jgi:hypothetical protein
MVDVNLEAAADRSAVAAGRYVFAAVDFPRAELNTPWRRRPLHHPQDWPDNADPGIAERDGRSIGPRWQKNESTTWSASRAQKRPGVSSRPGAIHQFQFRK